ncbi:hypothetical protein C6W10_27900 [Plantactinospora sp. BB1]|nr:hypothetical protein C6W10_27900 [Plantactinospora sp. BB1]
MDRYPDNPFAVTSEPGQIAEGVAYGEIIVWFFDARQAGSGSELPKNDPERVVSFPGAFEDSSGVQE